MIKYIFIWLLFQSFLSWSYEVSSKTVLSEQQLENSVNWALTDFSNQQAIGYTEDVFAIPKGLEERVSFWVDIYSQYSTRQGLLHDSRYVHIIYEAVDFSSIYEDFSLNPYQKERARKNLLKKKKKEITIILQKLHKAKNSNNLNEKEKRIWTLFQRVNSKNKFREATRKGRLRFQLGQSDRFLKGIYYSGAYLKQMESIFKKYELPLELTRLPFVESSFNINARSKAGASGIWQFMRYTGRQYLRMSNAVDERNDPIRSTEGAAKLFRFNYRYLGDWPLAVTAYNHGSAGVKRMLKKHGATSLMELVDKRQGRFRFASANFYASFLAALHVERNANKFFKEPKWEKVKKVREIKLSQSLNPKTLLSWFNNDLKQAKSFNLHIRRSAWKGWYLLRKNDFIRVPAESYEKVLAAFQKLPRQKSIAAGKQMYRISRGDSLSVIARRFRTSVRKIKNVNGITNPSRIRAGQKIIIPQ